MENGGLGEKFGELTVNDAKDSSLFQVMKAVEAAEATIHQQVEENSRLKAELQRRDQELENLKLDRSVVQKYNSGEASDEHGVVNRDPQLTSMVHLLSPISLYQEPLFRSNDPMRPYDADGHSSNNKPNGSKNIYSAGQTLENAGYSHLSSPTDISFSPGRYLNNGEYDSRTNVPAQGLMPLAESNNHSNLLKQIREHEMEISQLRKRLTEYSIKEAQIRNEKYILEKRIAHMRMAFDQQQQDLVDAASKALSYRQDIIEENVRLTYSLQDAQQERTTFVSSLLPLLADYSLQPQVSDAQSVVSNVKVLFKHLQEKLVITEAKLKESQYQLTPWRSGGNSPNFLPQSPDQSSSAAYISSKTGLELVPRPSYSPRNLAPDHQISSDWDSRGQHDHPAGATGAAVQNAVQDNTGRYSPLTSRDSAVHDVSTQSGFNPEELYNSKNRQVKFKEPVTSSELYGIAAEGHQNNESEHDGTWGPGASPYPNTYEDPSSSYPYLQPVPEEPSSSFSEAADDDPLPAIEGLQISGEACPGRELQACGYSTNGTTSCNFEWVRHLDDGSVQYIEGAKQPIYLVTADDVETYLAIEVQPLDDRKRKGELVRVFANDHRKINCDLAMHSHIQQTLRNGQTSYKVSLSTGYLDMWEPATLTIKREGYSIKGSGSSDVTINEKFLKATTVTITYGRDYEFSIDRPSGEVHLLKADTDIQDIARVTDSLTEQLLAVGRELRDYTSLYICLKRSDRAHIEIVHHEGRAKFKRRKKEEG